MAPPRRRDGKIPPFRLHDDWLDRALAEAWERGDFDDLPGHGKPLTLETNDLAPEWDMAFRVLKNAGFAPTWMELGKEIERATAALRAFLEETRAELSARQRELRAAGRSPEPGDATARARRRGWWRWWPFRARRPVAPPPAPAPDWAGLEARRRQARQRYLEQAAALDATIVRYHKELPDDLWWLQRGRRGPDEAARHFDTACPPIPPGGWPELPVATGEPAPGQGADGARERGALK